MPCQKITDDILTKRSLISFWIQARKVKPGFLYSVTPNLSEVFIVELSLAALQEGRSAGLFTRAPCYLVSQFLHLSGDALGKWGGHLSLEKQSRPSSLVSYKHSSPISCGLFFTLCSLGEPVTQLSNKNLRISDLSLACF